MALMKGLGKFVTELGDCYMLCLGFVYVTFGASERVQ